MDDGDEAHEAAGRKPQQIEDPILDRDVVLAIDGARDRVHGFGIVEQRFEFELRAVEPGPASFLRAAAQVRNKGDRIGLYPADQVVVLIEQLPDDLTGGIDTREMKSRTEYVARDCLHDVRRQIANYKRFKALSAEWIALSIEYSRLRMKLARRS